MKGHRVKCYDNNIQALNSVYARYQSDKAQLYADRVVESPNFTGLYLFKYHFNVKNTYFSLTYHL